MFLPEYVGHKNNLCNNLIQLPIIRCEFKEINAKYSTHCELAFPGNTALYHNIQINDDTLGTSYKSF